MSYTLSFHQTGSHLHVLFSGNFTHGDTKALWAELIEHIRRHHPKSVLVEEKVGTTGSIEIHEVYETAKMLADTKPIHDTKIAVLYQAGVSANTLDHALFGENIALKRGVKLKIFAHKNKAEQWLTA